MGLDLDMFWVDLELLGRILVDLEFLVWILNFWVVDLGGSWISRWWILVDLGFQQDPPV